MQQSEEGASMKNNHRMSWVVLCSALAFGGAACEDGDSKNTDAADDGGAGGGDSAGNGDGQNGANADMDGQNGDGGDAGDGGNGSNGEPKPRGAGNAPSLGLQIDRMGRPAINTALNATFESDAEIKGAAKDAYNAAGPATWSSFEGEIKKNLAILDSLDTNCGNQLLAGAGANRYATLASVLANDQIFVNSASGTCGVYLGLEGEFVGALKAGEGGCGGRTPVDDVIERSYSVLAAGILAGVDDTITKDDADHDITTFPWLAAPKN